MTAADVELAVVNYYNPRTNIIVPNVSWGLLGHEADLLVYTPRDRVHEVEIKVSVADTKADLKKQGHHMSFYIDKLWFAMPFSLGARAMPFIPDHAGVLLVRDEEKTVIRHREAKQNPVVRRYVGFKTDLLRLGNLRVWPLKKQILELTRHG